MKRFLWLVSIILLMCLPVSADFIKWVDFDVPYESLQYAMNVDIDSFEEEQHISWIDILSLAACRTGGKCGLASVKRAARELKQGKVPQELLEAFRYYSYYHEAYSAVLGGLLGSFAICRNGTWVPKYGLKAYSPIAEGYSYSHYDDFGASRSFGFQRKHLGNDLLGNPGTPIVAVEGGTVEAIGWNRYGGWRIAVRSFDGKRSYYYAHLRKNRPYKDGLEIGSRVKAGEVIGYLGMTGYSDKENVNGMNVPHLHLGMQLVFDETQKEGDNQIWLNMYALVELLNGNRSSVVKNEESGEYERVYDIFKPEYPDEMKHITTVRTSSSD